jgi:hypothetical protein
MRRTVGQWVAWGLGKLGGRWGRPERPQGGHPVVSALPEHAQMRVLCDHGGASSARGEERVKESKAIPEERCVYVCSASLPPLFSFGLYSSLHLWVHSTKGGIHLSNSLVRVHA